MLFRNEEIKRKGEETDSTKSELPTPMRFNFTTDTYIVHMYLLKMIDIYEFTQKQIHTHVYTYAKVSTMSNIMCIKFFLSDVIF